MSNTEKARSLYYDALIKLLDSTIKPELNSGRSQYAYHYVRRELARLATLNDHTSLVPENLAALHPQAVASRAADLSAEQLRDALAHEGKLLDEIEQATEIRMKPRRDEVTETSTALPDALSAATVQGYLRKAFDPAIIVSNLRVLSGGRSKQTIMMMTRDGAGHDIERVIRRDMSTSPTGSSVVDEFGLLRMLFEGGIPVPCPLLCEPDAALFGWPFIVVDKVAGELSGHIFDAPPDREMLLQAGRALGRLHALSAARIAPTLPASRATAPDHAALRTLVISMRDTWNERARAPSVSIDAAFDWMLAHVEKIRPLTALVHGDYSFHNLLYDGNQLSAVLDWELSRIGHPAEDLGYIRPAVLKVLPWETFMAAYRAAGGPAIEADEIIFFTLLEKMRLMTMMFRGRDFVDQGLTDDIEYIDAFLISMPRVIQQASMEIRQAFNVPRE